MKSDNTVLIIIPHLSIGGTEIQTLNLVRVLTANNYKVRVLCLYRNLPVVIEEYKKAGAEIYIASPQYDNPEIKIEYYKGFGLIKFLYSCIKKVLSMDEYKIVHVQYMTPGAISILMLYYIFGIRNIIATAHTCADIYQNLHLVHFIQRHCVRAFTCITEIAEKSFFGRSNLYNETTVLKRRNHFTIYNALLKTFNIITAERERNTPLTIGVVSRLEMIKGMDLVVPAFAKIKAKHPSATLLVVGDGILKEKMQFQAAELDCTHSITWAGRQSQQILPRWYQLMDIVLMPSRSEGFGLTAIEAMAQGCVVVASNVGGLPEVVRDGRVGLLHQSENVEDMAEKVNGLIDNPNQWAQLSGNAIDYVHRFSISAYEKLITDLYSKI